MTVAEPTLWSGIVPPRPEPDPGPVYTLRPYQLEADRAIINELREVDSTLLVMATGLGKTVTFCHTAGRASGRVLIVAHREEIVNQTAHTIQAITGRNCCVEMAERWADDDDKSPFVVASIQTLIAGDPPRMNRFDDFSLVIIDECHHAAAKSYRRMIKHFKQFGVKVLGVTATPDRADEKALGQIFESVAFTYEIHDAIRDGWLVPIEQNCVPVHGLDYGVIKQKRELSNDDVELVQSDPKVLQGFCSSTYEIADGRRTLMFAPTVKQADKMTEIFNRYSPACARFVHGGTPKPERRQLFRDYGAGAFQILVNVGVVTEGVDVPGIEVVSVARPTKSRALYCQMVGRGTRPLPGLVDGIHTSADRRQAIADSGKPKLEVLDFVGNAGRHKLMSVADVLGGVYDDDVIEEVRRNVRETADNRPVDIAGELERTKQRIEEAKRREAERRRHIIAKAHYTKQAVDPFNVFDISRPAKYGWDEGRQISAKQRALLKRQGIDADTLSFAEAKKVINELFRRWDAKMATFKQVKLLSRYGINAQDWTMERATEAITELKANGWKV